MSKPSNLYGVQVTHIVDAKSVDREACPVCMQTSVVPTYDIEGLDSQIVVCRQCGLGRFSPTPSAGQIAAFYPDDYYGDTGRKFEGLVETLVRIVAARQARFLTRGLSAGARVLDVGCGRGVMLRAFADRGFEVHGTEFSAAATRGADPRAKLHITSRLADTALPAESFDQIVLWHVFEHLPDPRETVEEIHRLLKPGGKCVIAVPNFSSLQARLTRAGWFHLDPPRHLFHFPVAALRRLLEQTGFECLTEHHFSLRQNPFGWVQSLLNRCSSFPRNGLYVLLHRSIQREKPFTRSQRWIFRLAFLFGMPVAVVLSVVAAILRQGATVTVVARRSSHSNVN